MRRLSLGVLFAAALLACSADSITDDVTPYAGDYTLRSINSFPLPYAVLKTDAETLEITDETFTLISTGGFVDITHYRRTVTPTVDFPSDTLRGTFTVRGQTINLTTSAGVVFTGTMGSGQFSIEGSSVILIYQK
jgi:hypothetical protein